jgi:hypothetical protein
MNGGNHDVPSNPGVVNIIFFRNRGRGGGRAPPGTDARIVDLDTGMMDMPVGETGELILKRRRMRIPALYDRTRSQKCSAFLTRCCYNDSPPGHL